MTVIVTVEEEVTIEEEVTVEGEANLLKITIIEITTKIITITEITLITEIIIIIETISITKEVIIIKEDITTEESLTTIEEVIITKEVIIKTINTNEGIETLEMTKMTSKVKDNGQILMMIQKEGIIKVKNKTGLVIMRVMETSLEKERVIIISQVVKIIRMIQNQKNKTKEKIHLTLFLVMIISNKQKNNKRIIKNQHQLEKTHLMMIHSMTLKNKIKDM